MDTNRHIRLTQDRPHQSGYVWSRAPLPGKSFEITWEFRVDGKGSAGADGMAMWLTQGRAEKGPVFGSKDYFDGLGIFFDTYANARHVSSCSGLGIWLDFASLTALLSTLLSALWLPSSHGNAQPRCRVLPYRQGRRQPRASGLLHGLSPYVRLFEGQADSSRGSLSRAPAACQGVGPVGELLQD